MNQTHTLLPHLLRTPGRGVFTVHTADEIITHVQNNLYQTSDRAQIEALWQQDVQQVLQSTHPILLGICSDCGGGIQRGANWGPLWIRHFMMQQKQQYPYLDLGDIPVIPHLLHDSLLNEQCIRQCQEALYPSLLTGDQLVDATRDLPVAPLSIAQTVCELLYADDHCPYLLALGGDHSVSYPLTYTWLKARRKAGKRVAIIHFDAHTDLLDRRQGVDLCFATWAYHILPELEQASDLIQLGIRSSGRSKEHWQDTLGVQQYWADEVVQRIDHDLCEEILHTLAQKKVDEVYISIDIDALDERFASATGTPEPDGLRPEHILKVIDSIAAQYTVSGADLVEVAPWVHRSIDFVPSDVHPYEYTKTTLEVAAQLAQKLLFCLQEGQKSSKI